MTISPHIYFREFPDTRYSNNKNSQRNPSKILLIKVLVLLISFSIRKQNNLKFGVNNYKVRFALIGKL